MDRDVAGSQAVVISPALVDADQSNAASGGAGRAADGVRVREEAPGMKESGALRHVSRELVIMVT